MKCDAYSNRTQKVKQWEEVTNNFSDQNASVEEKSKHGKLLQQRWRTLRDGFVKQRRELATTKSGSAATNKKYKYYNQLLFLLPVVAMNTTHNSMEGQENNDSVDEQHDGNIPNLPEPKKPKKNYSTDKIGSELVNVLKSTLQRKTDEESSDRQFMLSLVNDFKRVPERSKPRVKINILKCILEAQDEVGHYYEYASYSNQYSGYHTEPHRERTENTRPSNQPSSSRFNVAAEEYPYTGSNFSNNQQSHVETSTLAIADQISPISLNTQDSEESELLPLFEN